MSPWRRRLAGTVAALVVLVVGVGAADGERRLFDLTEDDTLTLSPQTEDVLASVDRDIDITVFARPTDAGRVEVVSLLDRYRRLQRRIDVEVLDPDRSPGEVARLGVDPAAGGTVVRAGDRVEAVPFPTEGELTGAIARLLRDAPTRICATTGHGERSMTAQDGQGLSRLADLLSRDGHEVSELDLLAGQRIDDTCTVVLMAAPTGALSPAAERAVADWVDDDGRLLLLTDPTAGEPPLAGLLDELGLRLERGVVLEGDAGNVVGGDVSAPIVTRYPSASPITRRLAPTFFPLVQEVRITSAEAGGRTAFAVAVTSETSYLERSPVAATFDPADDRPGPVTVVAAVDDSRVAGDDVRRRRVVVTGDADFASDDAIGQAGNAQLVRQAVAWLAQTEDLVAISPNLPADRPLHLTDARLRYLRVLSVGIVPGLFLLAGVLGWAVRRGR